MDEYDETLEEELMQFAFGEVTDTSREIYAKLGRDYPDGAVLFRQGSAGEDLFVILSGQVVVSQTAGSEEHLELARLGPGELLGEMSHFDELPRSATATACGHTRVLGFNRANFSLIFQLHPKWTTKLVEGLSHRIASMLRNTRPAALSKEVRW